MSPTNSSSLEWLRRNANAIASRNSLTDQDRTVASTVEVEAWLQRRGVKYAPATAIPLHLVDAKRSLANQARKDALVSDSVERYVVGFKKGDPFPPIVCYAVGNKLVIVDGNNRFAAAKKAGQEFILGIVIDELTPSDLIQLLTVEANARHGKVEPLEWRVKQAIGLIGLGRSLEESAEAAGVSATQLRNAKKAYDADHRARLLKIFGFSDLSTTAKMYLSALRDDPVFKAASILVVGRKLSVEQVMQLVRDVKAARSESERLDVIRDAGQEYEVDRIIRTGKGKGFGSPPQRIFSGAGIFNACDPGELVASIRTRHDRDEVNRRLEEASNKILDIQVAMEALKDMEED